jgi:Domain of unknown function (DUF4265)
MTVPDHDRDGEHTELVRVRFQLHQDEAGWPPVASEGVWAVPLGGDVVRLDNIPWFVRDAASGDTFGTWTDSDGVRWATDKVAWSGNCTIRVIPFPDGALAGSRQAVLDVFAPLGVDGEGLQQFGMVTLNIPPDAESRASRASRGSTSSITAPPAAAWSVCRQPRSASSGQMTSTGPWSCCSNCGGAGWIAVSSWSLWPRHCGCRMPPTTGPLVGASSRR